jgi:hypothetical protein
MQNLKEGKTWSMSVHHSGFALWNSKISLSSHWWARKNISQMKHQIDATLCRFYFCRVTLHISGVKRPSSGVFKTTPDDGRLRPKHVEWLCRNKICTVLHQVCVSFDLYYDARKHKIKIVKIYWSIGSLLTVVLFLGFWPNTYFDI